MGGGLAPIGTRQTRQARGPAPGALPTVRSKRRKPSQLPSPAAISASSELPDSTAQARPPQASARTMAGIRTLTVRPSRARFHGIKAPIGKNRAKDHHEGGKGLIEEGRPDREFAVEEHLGTSGQTVPTNTTSAATASRILFTTSEVSRETIANTPLSCIEWARKAYSVRAPPTNAARIPRMKTPRCGSEAKE